MIRLFKDDAGEMLSEKGYEWDVKIVEALHPLVKEAVKTGVSLRDLSVATNDVIQVLTAEERIRAGIKARRKTNE